MADHCSYYKYYIIFLLNLSFCSKIFFKRISQFGTVLINSPSLFCLLHSSAAEKTFNSKASQNSIYFSCLSRLWLYSFYTRNVYTTTIHTNT